MAATRPFVQEDSSEWEFSLVYIKIFEMVFVAAIKRKLARLIVKTPAYPHWLEFRRLDELTEEIVGCLQGSVLEVGAGDGTFKIRALAQNTRISKYTATDFDTWNESFESDGRRAESSSLIDNLYQRKKRETLDATCSALNLPFPDASFDCHVSIEVLEHIDDPHGFFKEAARVLKPGGIMALTAPFIFRVHPDESSDFFRLLPGAYAKLARDNGMDVERLHANTGMGAAASYHFIQWILRAYFDANWIAPARWFLLLMIAPLSLAANLFGALCDWIYFDRRFASRFLVITRKTIRSS